MDTLDLHMKVSAVAPIDGVTVGDPGNKTTWKCSFKPAATTPQKAAAQTVIDDYDFAAVDSTAVTRMSEFNLSSEVVDLIGRAKSATNAQIDTWLANNVTNLAQARTILGALIKLLIARDVIG